MSEEPDFTEDDAVLGSDPYSPVVAETRERQGREREDATTRAKRSFVERRRNAYRAVFRTGNSTAEDRALVLQDMTMFCRGGSTAWDADPRVHALLTGRQEYWLRVNDQLSLEVDELMVKYDQQKE